MTKIETISDPNSCLNKAKDDEPVFILLGRDMDAPMTIEKWCDFRVQSGKNKFEDEQIQDALNVSAQMRLYGEGLK